jgi:gliding motility-associated-like protein
MEEQQIEKLFRNGLGNLESDVNPDAWKNISKQLEKPDKPIAGATPTGKLASTSRNLVMKLIVAGVIFTAIIGTVSYLVKDKSTSTTNKNTVLPVTKQDESVIINETTTQLVNSSATPLAKEANTKTEVQKSVQPISSTATASRVKANKTSRLGPDTKTQVYMLTPNGDGENDYFKPLLDGRFKEYELTILDPKGNAVFKAKDSSAQWDGKLDNGLSAPAQVYTYVVNAKDLSNSAKTYKGTVALVR